MLSRNSMSFLIINMSRTSLVTSGLRNFLDYGGGKRVCRKGYVDANFDTNLDDPK